MHRGNSELGLLVLCTGMLLITSVTSIPLENFYHYGYFAGDNLVGRTLDGSSPLIILPAFSFFGQTFRNISVSLD